VNGVLRNISRRKAGIAYPPLAENPARHITLKYSHPLWLVERWLEEFGAEDTISLCQANNKPAPNTVRANTLRVTRRELAESLQEEGLTVRETALAPEGLKIEGFFSVGSLASFKQGLFQVQDESSMLAGRALAPAPGSAVLDACGAPGGKTTHLAQLMGNRGEILAVDVHPHKLELIRENSDRLGIAIIKTMAGDARKLHEGFTNYADFVLVDAPCSGLGVLRRRPDARWRKEAGQIAELVVLQAEILDAAARCVKPCGVLVYSTCTITREENLGQVESFLSRHPDFKLDDLTGLLPGELDYDSSLSRGYVQILPGWHEMDGFFIARMRKKGIAFADGE
ncbi:MAG: 16S rRNA (cytosine(967)-C(5))-methyltransferase RsmB, partial [Peptococcaceae bacterium]|nr:16S rRNA (cytosine(967)-C(5))-methyltransferase RsmB [Peptococcaceae bacterium]